LSQKRSKQRKEIYEIQASFCKALAHPVRLEIFDLLSQGEKTVSEIVDAVGLPQSTISQHLAFMRRLRIVKARREGVNVYYSLAYPELKKACDIIREVVVKMIREMPSLLEEIDEESS